MTNPADERTAIKKVAGTGVPVRGDDIDTDRIVPARFLKEITFDNMGNYAFYDARRNEDGSLNDHPFNRYPGANVLVVNENFGCGSSREHAPQALMRWGVEAVVGESFAEIFADNCKSLGIPTATADEETVEKIQDRIEGDPGTSLELGVDDETLVVDGDEFDVEIDEGQKTALVRGIWDSTALLRSSMDMVENTAVNLPYIGGFD
ncbi:MAG: 3-isopropylmalate dehydratase small subunit 2 [Halobacteria archaeon]